MNASKWNTLQHRSVLLKACRVNGRRSIGFESITEEREPRLALKINSILWRGSGYDSNCSHPGNTCTQ